MGFVSIPVSIMAENFTRVRNLLLGAVALHLRWELYLSSQRRLGPKSQLNSKHLLSLVAPLGSQGQS